MWKYKNTNTQIHKYIKKTMFPVIWHANTNTQNTNRHICKYTNIVSVKVPDMPCVVLYFLKGNSMYSKKYNTMPYNTL